MRLAPLACIAMLTTASLFLVPSGSAAFAPSAVAGSIWITYEYVHFSGTPRTVSCPVVAAVVVDPASHSWSVTVVDETGLQCISYFGIPAYDYANVGPLTGGSCTSLGGTTECRAADYYFGVTAFDFPNHYFFMEQNFPDGS